MTARVGTGKWTEEKLRELAGQVESGDLTPQEGVAAGKLYSEAYQARIARAAMARKGEDLEKYLSDGAPDMKLIEGGKQR